MSCGSCDDGVTSLSLIFCPPLVFVWLSAYLRSEVRVGLRAWANVKQSL